MSSPRKLQTNDQYLLPRRTLVTARTVIFPDPPVRCFDGKLSGKKKGSVL